MKTPGVCRRFLLARGFLFFVMAMACAGKLAAQSASVEILHSFSGPPEGSKPDERVIQGSDGNFYGETGSGGSAGDGTIFQITPAGVLTTLYSFTGGADGDDPEGGLTQGSDGNFYGTTFSGGGDNAFGTVFKITPAGALTTLFTFTLGANGGNPNAGLTLGTDGNFYGTTQSGTVFQITPAGALTTLYTFTDAHGSGSPRGGLIQGSDGNFYGTTAGGGNNHDGTIFQITPAGVPTILYTFSGGAGGRDPEAGLTQGSDGNFYGTTFGGGDANGDGTVFEITPAGVLTTLYTFTGGADGANPTAGLTFGADGNLYGAALQAGGSNDDGTIFKVTPAGAFTVVYTFSGGAGDGANPKASLTLGSDGSFYGATYNGGQSGLGVVFRLTLPSPVIPSETASAQVGVAFSFQIVGSNNPTSFGASNLPAGLTVDAATGIISGVPTQSGTFTVGLTATNAAGAGAGTLTLTVDPAAPVITSAAGAGGQEGQAFTFQITASNAPAAFGASGLPAGLSVDTTTGIISGTPTVSGKFSVSLSATNAGGTGTSVLSISLAPALPVVTLAATVPQAVVGSGEAGKFTLSIPAPLSANLVIQYSIKGTAINGVDYQLIKGKKTIKAGKTAKIINILPEGDLQGASKKVVTLVLKPEAGYTVGTTGKVKVKILP